MHCFYLIIPEVHEFWCWGSAWTKSPCLANANPHFDLSCPKINTHVYSSIDLLRIPKTLTDSKK